MALGKMDFSIPIPGKGETEYTSIVPVVYASVSPAEIFEHKAIEAAAIIYLWFIKRISEYH